MRRLPQCRNFYPQANNRTEWMNLARLQEAEGGESRDRGASQRHTEDHSGEHVAEEMHPQHDAGQRNAKRQEKQRSFQRGIEIAQDQRDGKCRHRMARWKGELIGRQYLRPAVRLDLAGPEAVAELLQRLENKNPRNRCGAGRADCRVPLRSAKEKKHDSESVPDPAVPHPSRGNHPDPKPARCAPAVHPPHQALIAEFDVSPDAACHRHGVTSTCPVGLETRIHVPQHSPAPFAALQLSSPFLAETNFVDPVIQSECRNQYCQRRSQESPRLIVKERFHDAVHVQRELQATPVLSLDASLGPRASPPGTPSRFVHPALRYRFAPVRRWCANRCLQWQFFPDALQASWRWRLLPATSVHSAFRTQARTIQTTDNLEPRVAP